MMGYNTVAVIYNDMTGYGGRSLERLDEAVRSWTSRQYQPHNLAFGFDTLDRENMGKAAILALKETINGP